MIEPPEERAGRNEEEVPPEEERPPIVPEPDEDDFDRIRFQVGDRGRVLAVRLEGPHVGAGEIDADVAGDFLVRVEKLVHGVAAAARGVSIPRRGAIPRPEGAAPLRLSASVAPGSVDFTFALGPGEAMLLDVPDPSSPTVAAVQNVVDLLETDPHSDVLVEELKSLGDRIGNEFVDFLEFLAVEEVDTRWRAPGRASVRVSRGDARRGFSYLRTEAEPVTGEVEVAGDLFRADSHRNSFRLEPRDGPTISGTYSSDLVEDVRSAWAKTVLVRLKQTEYRWIYSREPKEVVYELVKVVEILGPAGHEPPDEDEVPF